jgi:hypothetical protein
MDAQKKMAFGSVNSVEKKNNLQYGSSYNFPVFY